jgi:hypothetical protein
MAYFFLWNKTQDKQKTKKRETKKIYKTRIMKMNHWHSFALGAAWWYSFGELWHVCAQRRAYDTDHHIVNKVEHHADDHVDYHVNDYYTDVEELTIEEQCATHDAVGANTRFESPTANVKVFTTTYSP